MKKKEEMKIGGVIETISLVFNKSRLISKADSYPNSILFFFCFFFCFVFLYLAYSIIIITKNWKKEREFYAFKILTLNYCLQNIVD
jgi:hypothetical protein